MGKAVLLYSYHLCEMRRTAYKSAGLSPTGGAVRSALVTTLRLRYLTVTAAYVPEHLPEIERILAENVNIIFAPLAIAEPLQVTTAYYAHHEGKVKPVYELLGEFLGNQLQKHSLETTSSYQKDAFSKKGQLAAFLRSPISPYDSWRRDAVTGIRNMFKVLLERGAGYGMAFTISPIPQLAAAGFLKPQDPVLARITEHHYGHLQGIDFEGEFDSLGKEERIRIREPII